MRAYATDGPFEVSVRTTSDAATATVYDSSGAAASGSVSCDVSGGTATCRIEPSGLELDTYLVKFSCGGSAVVVLCDRPYFTVEGFRDYDNGSKLSSSVTDDQIVAARSHVEGVFERAAGVAFCLRGSRELISSSGYRLEYRLRNAMPQRIVSCSVDGFDVSSRARLRDGYLVLPSRTVPGTIIDVHYEHGYADPPEALEHNAMLYANAIIGSPSVNPRATGQEMEFGYIKYSVAGKDGATGIPEVDAFLSSDPSCGGFGSRGLVIA